MRAFIVRRLVYSTFALIGVTLVIFAFSRVLRDPRTVYLQALGESGYGVTEEKWRQLGESLHLDDPLLVQYYYWVSALVTGDLGEDLVDKVSIATKLRQRIPITTKLAITSWLLAIVVGVPIGIMSAVKRGTVVDLLGRGFALLGQTMPAFWLGIMGIMFFSVQLRWLPSALPGEGLFPVRNMIMPAFVLAFGACAGFARLTRSAMLEVLDSEYIKLARAKGVKEWVVIWKHAFRNAMIPPLTLAGMLLATFLHGAIVVEVVFAWPGLGRLAVESVWNNNFPVLAVVTLLFSGLFITANFLVDVCYAYVDPRIRYS